MLFSATADHTPGNRTLHDQRRSGSLAPAALWYDGKDPAIISKLPPCTCHPPPESENLSLLKRAIRYLTGRSDNAAAAG